MLNCKCPGDVVVFSPVYRLIAKSPLINCKPPSDVVIFSDVGRLIGITPPSPMMNDELSELEYIAKY